MAWLKSLGNTLGKIIKGGGNPSKVVTAVVNDPKGVTDLISAGDTVKKAVIAAGSIATAGALGAGLAGGGSLVSRLTKGADIVKSGNANSLFSNVTSKLVDSVKSSNPIVNKLVENVSGGATNFIKSQLTQQFGKWAVIAPSVINSPRVDQFTETKTGLQQSVFGSPVSDTYNKLVDVSWGGGGLEDFNVSTGSKDEKKQSVPVWAWIGGGILAFFGMLAIFGKIKFR